MIKTVTINTKSLEDGGAIANGFFAKNEKANIKTIVDAEQLAKDIEKQSNKLIKDGYQILNILPITSEKIIAHSLKSTYTSSVIITALKQV